MWGGWGIDLLNADDMLGTTGDTDEAPDTHPHYEDRAFAGASYDILIGNTGGDRLIDWVGEFNTYLVPFSPFGIATVSRQRPPALDEFLYALSKAQGADPTRATDTGNSAVRNGEPDGEMGLVTQKDHGLWQDQTGGPTDPQAGNIPGGQRDVLRSADFNDGTMSTFAPDSGSWTVQQGALSVAAASQGADAAAVFYVDDYLPLYYEISAAVKVQKPTGGWKANAYVIFDYFSPTDFKFAGIDVSTNKLVMGHRDAGGWRVDRQTPAILKPDRFYNILVGINGTAVTVLVDNKYTLSWTFPDRIIDGVSYGLNKGLIGMGSDNSRGVYDNVAAMVLPPQITLDHDETFNDGVANLFNGDQSGTWTAAAGRYDGAPPVAGGLGWDTVELGTAIHSSSYLELEGTLRTSTIGGIYFDRHAADRYKFVALDVPGQKVLIGHLEPRRGWVVDLSIPRALVANRDYAIKLTLKGASVSVTLDGQMLTSYGYNGGVVDGAFGVLTKIGTTSFDRYRIRTNDPAFVSGGSPLTAASSIAAAPNADRLDEALLAQHTANAAALWASQGVPAETLDAVHFAVADLTADKLGLAFGSTIYIDANAAGYGWSFNSLDVDLTDRGMDLLTVVMHEMGHALGLDDDYANPASLMHFALGPGEVRHGLFDDGGSESALQIGTFEALAAPQSHSSDSAGLPIFSSLDVGRGPLHLGLIRGDDRRSDESHARRTRLLVEALDGMRDHVRRRSGSNGYHSAADIVSAERADLEPSRTHKRRGQVANAVEELFADWD